MGSGRRARSQLAALGAVTTWVICRVRLVISVQERGKQGWSSGRAVSKSRWLEAGQPPPFPQIVALRRRELVGRPEAKDVVLKPYLLCVALAFSPKPKPHNQVEGRASPDLQRSNSWAVLSAFLFFEF